MHVVERRNSSKFSKIIAKFERLFCVLEWYKCKLMFLTHDGRSIITFLAKLKYGICKFYFERQREVNICL